MDNLDDLPIDETKQTSQNELQLLKKYFGNDKQQSGKLFGELKEVFIATVLFALLSTDFFDRCLDYLPYTGSPFVKYGLKLLIFATILYVAIIMLN